MTNIQKVSILALRVTMGWMFFWAGITKILNPEWSAIGYLSGAKNFNQLFEYLSSPNILPIVNFVNEWGLALLGVSLILGVLVNISIPLGILLMVLYYLPLGFPAPNAHSYIVDEHIIYIFSLALLWVFGSGNVWSVSRIWRSR